MTGDRDFEKRWAPTPLIVGILLALTSCGGAAGSAGAGTPRGIYKQQLCPSCHGPGREGSWMGPPLRHLGRNWDRERLAEFLLDPTPFIEQDERLKALSRTFRAPMTPRPKLELEQRLLLADWLLEKR